MKLHFSTTAPTLWRWIPAACCSIITRGTSPRWTSPCMSLPATATGTTFSPVIFQLAQGGKEVHYLLSDDISPLQVPKELKSQVTFLAPYAFCQVGAVQVATLRSTDMGVAFLIQCEGKRLYHAGDLNCWVWDGAPVSERPDAGPLPPGAAASFRRQEDRRGLCAPGPPAGGGLRPGDEVLLRGGRGRVCVPHAHVGDYSVVPLFKSTPTYREYAPHVMDVSQPGQTFEI